MCVFFLLDPLKSGALELSCLCFSLKAAGFALLLGDLRFGDARLVLDLALLDRYVLLEMMKWTG